MTTSATASTGLRVADREARDALHRAEQVALLRRRRRSRACSSISSVGTNTSDMTKSTITPTAAPMPNDRTATTSLVASDSRPSAVVPLAPSSGTNRCWTLDLNACSLLAGRAQLVVEVLHDVHVVGDRQDDDERRQHAGEHVVGEPHQHEEAHRPDDADEHGDDEQPRDAPRAEHHDRCAPIVSSRIGGVSVAACSSSVTRL